MAKADKVPYPNYFGHFNSEVNGCHCKTKQTAPIHAEVHKARGELHVGCVQNNKLNLHGIN